VQAQEFSVWLASAEIQRTLYFDAGGQPGNSKAWEDPRLNSLTEDFFTGTRKTLEEAYLRPRDKRFISVQDEISINMTKCLTGEINDLLFAESANEICERLMGENHGI
jgi:multiple sugar transport system substrate-binding protein